MVASLNWSVNWSVPLLYPICIKDFKVFDILWFDCLFGYTIISNVYVHMYTYCRYTVYAYRVRPCIYNIHIFIFWIYRDIVIVNVSSETESSAQDDCRTGELNAYFARLAKRWQGQEQLNRAGCRCLVQCCMETWAMQEQNNCKIDRHPQSAERWFVPGMFV